MRKQYSTSLQPDIIKALKLQSVEENRPANEIIEDALKNYLEESVKVYKKYYREIENGYGSDNQEYQVIEVDDEDIVTEHYISNTIRVYKEDVLNLEKYQIEREHDADAMITNNDAKDSYIANNNELPAWFVSLIDKYEKDIDWYNEEQEEQITELKVNAFLKIFHQYNLDYYVSSKVVYIWDGSNHQRYILEDDVCDTEFCEDTEGMFDNFNVLDSEYCNREQRAIVENKEGKYLQTISNYQCVIGVSYESINTNIETLEEYDEYKH